MPYSIAHTFEDLASSLIQHQAMSHVVAGTSFEVFVVAVPVVDAYHMPCAVALPSESFGEHA